MPTQQAAKPVSLTQVAAVARKGIIIGGLGLVVLVVGRFFLDSFVTYWVVTHPTPPPAPTRGFGVLPAISFPKVSQATQTYTLEAPPQALAQQSDRAPVFFMPAQRASLLSLDKAKTQANNLGFLLEPAQITSSLYRWSRNQPLQSILDFNIDNGTFTVKLNWQSDPNFLQQKNLPTEDEAINMTKSLLSSAGLMQPDIATGAAKVTYLKASANGYAPAVSLSESDFLQVDIFRTPIGGRYEFSMDDPSHGVVRAIITGSSDLGLRFALVDYKYLPVDYVNFETYPIISPTQAFDLLKAGKGYTASSDQTQTNVVIRSFRIGYFDSFNQQSYLQPIYILEGDGGYVGYVPAVSAIWSQ